MCVMFAVNSTEKDFYHSLNKMAELMGIIPIQSKHNKKIKVFYKIYLTILIAAFLILAIWQLSLRTERHAFTGSLLLYILDILEGINEILVMSAMITINLFKGRKWSQFFDLTKILLLPNNKHKMNYSYIDKRILIFILCIFPFNDVLQFLYMFIIYNKTAAYISMYITNFYVIFTSIIYSQLASLINAKQREILAYLARSKRRSYVLSIEEFVELKTLLSFISKIVANLNRLFGWRILFLFVQFVLMIANFIATIYFNLHNKMWILTVGDAVRIIIYASTVLILIESCDRIEKTNGAFVVSCYYLQEVLSNGREMEELQHLAAYAEHMRPTCSAAGFFNINRPVIGPLVSCVITYLIICVQFNLTLK